MRLRRRVDLNVAMSDPNDMHSDMTVELEQLGERIAEQAAHVDAAMHRLLTDLREFDERGGWYVQGARSCAHWLAWRVGWDLVTARERVRVAGKLAEFPTIDDALRRGEVSYSKVRAMVRVATPANESLLLDHARLMTASQLETLCRKYAVVQRHGQDPHLLGDQQRRYVRRRDTDDGMVEIKAVLHPEEAELVWAMLDHAATRLAREPGSSVDNDSAESREGAQASAAPGGPVMNAAPVSEPMTAPPLSDALAGLIDDSAEARDPTSVPSIATTATASPGYFDTCLIGDSAESWEQPSAPHTTAIGSAGHVDLAPIDDSAKSQEPTSVPDTRVAASSGCTGTRPTHDSAESPGSEIPGRSLLDRLLDEADALRNTEAVAHGEPGTSPSIPGASSSSLTASLRDPGTGRAPGALHQRADAARRAFNRADALISLAQGYLRGDRPDRAPIEITLTIPASSLRGDPADPVEVGEMGASFVSREAARRLGCDGGVVEVVEDEHGAPLSVGRKRRTIAGALKRALRKRDTTCTYPGCTNRIFLEGHHIKHWADGGETSLTNISLLCSLHHRFVHEYGYAIELGPDQRPRFRDPSGRLIAEAPERPAMADLGWPGIRAANAPLSITADTIACGWDGTPADYGAIIGHLVAADGLR